MNQDIGVVKTSTGVFVTENKIVNHVIEQVAMRSFPNGANSITIKLQPEELGKLKSVWFVVQTTGKAEIQAEFVRLCQLRADHAYAHR